MTAPEGMIERRKLSHAVLDRLTARILSGEVPPGATLPSERELMAAYGVGRPAIREAMQQLARDGLVSISHGERARVTVPQADDILSGLKLSVGYLLDRQPDTLAQLKDARLLLETGLARAAALRADAAALDRLKAALEAHRHAALEDFLARDIAFHVAIAAATGNTLFPLILDSVLTWLAAYHRPILRAPGAEHLTLAEHASIVEAIAARDADRAEAAMAAHLARTSGLYEQCPG